MTLLRSVGMAFAMFSKIPMPRIQWEKQNMRLTLAALPLVGAVIGLALWGWLWLADTLGLDTIPFAAGLTLLPVLITGGIHLDGFCDTIDALSSHAEPERKREILKDPHLGAFAAIGLCCYLLAHFALCTGLDRDVKSVWLLGLSLVISRAVGGLCSLVYPRSSGEGLLYTFSVSADKRTAAAILAGILCIAGACAVALSTASGVCMLLVSLLCALYLYRMSMRRFGGMSGDLAGFVIELSELAMLVVLYL